MSNLIAQKEFLVRLQNSVDSMFGLESAFTLVCIEPLADKNGRYSVTEALGILSAAISRALVKEGDFYSFFENKFYILTQIDNKKIITDFVNSLALKLGSIYASDIYLNAGFSQYPYDAMNVQDLLAVIISSMERIRLKRYDFDTGQITEQDPNYVLGTELTQYLKQIKEYSDVLYKHSLFVAKISLDLAKALNFANQAIKRIVIAAILHDLGYLMISRYIFLGSKQCKVKNATTIKLHPLLATRKILADKSMFKSVLPLIEQHHEFLDGGGYPFGLSRIDLTLESQIISIADTYALVKDQPNLKLESLVEFFAARSGIRWEEQLTEVFIIFLRDEKYMKSLNTMDNLSLKELFNIT